MFYLNTLRIDLKMSIFRIFFNLKLHMFNFQESPYDKALMDANPERRRSRLKKAITMTIAVKTINSQLDFQKPILIAAVSRLRSVSFWVAVLKRVVFTKICMVYRSGIWRVKWFCANKFYKYWANFVDQFGKISQLANFVISNWQNLLKWLMQIKHF